MELSFLKTPVCEVAAVDHNCCWFFFTNLDGLPNDFSTLRDKKRHLNSCLAVETAHPAGLIEGFFRCSANCGILLVLNCQKRKTTGALLSGMITDQDVSVDA